MVYLTEAEFDSMGGDAGAVTAFQLYQAKAAQLIDQATHSRLKNESPVRECVKYCMVELIGALQVAESHGGRAVTSVSNDGVSIGYASEDPQAAYARILRAWLGGEVSRKGIPLLYAGVDA